MHHSLNQFMDKLLISRSMMVTTSLLHSWVNFVEPPGLLPLRPQERHLCSFQVRSQSESAKASVPSSQKVSAVFVLGICHGLVSFVTSLITRWFPACGSTISADDVGGEIASPRYPYSYPPNQNCSWIIHAQEPCKSLVILGIHNLKVKTKAFCILNYLTLFSDLFFLIFQSIMWLCPSLTLSLRWWIVTALMIVWRSWMETNYQAPVCW